MIGVGAIPTFRNAPSVGRLRIYPVKFAKALVRSIPSTRSEKRRPFNLPVPNQDACFLCWLGDGVNHPTRLEIPLHFSIPSAPGSGEC